uniref:mucin-2-like n=1 Tax=Doryrhamphus excisus TaxID=161450 RepID=UPI0025ADB5CE|nr:mucin-2-like [Doryrhamphus excisus]
MGNTQVEVELQFNDSVSTDQIPGDDVVVDTLVQAVTSPNTFNPTIDPDSIAVITKKPTTTTHRPTTQGLKTTQIQTTTQLLTTHRIISQGPISHGPSTSQVPTSTELNTTQVHTTHGPTNTHIPRTNGPTSTKVAITDGPTTTKVAITDGPTTTKVAITDGPTSTQVFETHGPTNTNGQKTTNGPTTSVTSVLSPVVFLQATVEKPFVEELNDPSSEQYQTLQTQVVSMCDFIFLEAFGSIFIRTVVKEFRPQMGNTQVEVELQFNDSVSTDQIPEADAVVDTLVKAVTSPNNTFNLTIDPDSIAVIPKKPTTTTHGPMTTHRPTTQGLKTTQIQTTTELRTTHRIISRGPISHGPSTSQVPTSTELNTTQVHTTHGPTNTHIPRTNGPTTTKVAITDGPTSTKVAITDGPTSTKVAITDGPTSTKVAITDGPTTTKVAITDGPTSNQVFETHGPTNTNGQKTTTTTTTSVTSVLSPVVFLQATVEEPFVEEFNDPSSEQYQTLQTQVVSMCDFIFLEAFGSIFIRTIVKAFRPQMGNTQVEVELQFNNSVSSDVVVDTMVKAVTSPDNTFTLTIDPDSIAVISKKPTTTHGPMTTPITAQVHSTHGPTATSQVSPTHGPTTSPPPVVILSATLEEPFVEEFNDVNSEQYKALETQVVTTCDIIYRARFGFIFIRTYVIQIIRAVVITRMDNTRVDVGLEFVDTASTPQDDLVVSTLQETLSQPNNTFNISIVQNSVQVLQSPHKANSTTAKPASTTKKAPSTPLQLTIRTLRFTSVGETFISDLLNQSSVAFIARALMMKTTLEPFYSSAFSSFNSLRVTSFSNGSIINNMNLRFISGSVPNNTAIGQVLIDAAPNITAFNVDVTSIFVNGMQLSSGTSHKTSIITASCLALLSWLLSSQH